MKFVVLFEDNSGLGSAVRSEHMPQHLNFLETNKNKILAAGPLSSTDGTGAGGLWLVETDTEEVVHTLVRQDPFWPTGLRKSVKVLGWNQVFADGQRLIKG
ncbi:MAG: YciI family protein [Pseudomonadota bacterium]